MMVTSEISKHIASSAIIVSIANSCVQILSWCGLLPDAQNLPTGWFSIDQVEEAYTLLQLQYSDDPQGGIVLIYAYINGY